MMSLPRPHEPSPPRDETLDDDDLSTDTPQPRRRRRPAHACLECRRRKIKCDLRSPCAHCRVRNARCVVQVYRDGPKSVARRQPASDRAPAPAPTPSSTAGLVLPPLVLPPLVVPPVAVPPTASQQSADMAVDTCLREVVTSQPAIPPVVVHSMPTPAASWLPDRLDHGISRGHDSHGYDSIGYVLERARKLDGMTQSGVNGGDGSGNGGASDSTTGRGVSPPSATATAPPTWQPMINKTKDLGRSGWMGAAHEFDDIIECWGEIVGNTSGNAAYRHPETAALVAQASDFHNRCKRLARQIKQVRPTRGESVPSAVGAAPTDTTTATTADLPSRETSDAMARLYFSSFESCHRILHAPTFWAEYGRFWAHPPEASPAERRLTVALVVGLGSSLFDHGSAEASLRNAEAVHRWIYAAETWRAGSLEKDRVSVAGLQVACLSLLARQVFAMGGDTVWMSAGTLVHQAMQLGLNRDPSRLPGPPMPPLQAEVRRRLWATIVDLVVQASLDARMPPRIGLDEFDTQPPADVEDESLGLAGSTGSAGSTGPAVSTGPALSTGPPFTPTSMQRELLRSLPVRLRIVQLLNGAGGGAAAATTTQYDHILALNTQLTDALGRIGRFAQRGHGTPFGRSLLDYLVRRFVIPLHFFFSHRARAEPVYHYSLRCSVDAAAAIMAGRQPGRQMSQPDSQQQQQGSQGQPASEMSQPGQVGQPAHPDPAFARLLVSAGGLFREGLRVASIAAGLALLVHVCGQRRDGSLLRAPQYRSLLRTLVQDMVVLADQRIRYGETNVKTHMFLRMILAQVEAVEAGDVGSGTDTTGADTTGTTSGYPQERRIARSARDSLEHCCGLLQARLDSNSLVSSLAATPAASLAAVGADADLSFGPGFGLDLDWEAFLPDQGVFDIM